MLSRKNKKFLFRWGIVILIVWWSILLIYWLLSPSPLPQIYPPFGLQLLPQETTFVASFSTNSEKWQQLESLGNTETQTLIRKPLSNFADSLLKANGYNYSTHIQPWLGEEITLAYLELPTSALRQQSQPSQNSILILPIKDIKTAKKLLDDSKFERRESYKNIPLYTITHEKELNYFVAIVNDAAIVTRELSTLKQIIDNSKKDISTAKQDQTAQNEEKPEKEIPFAKFYIKPSALFQTDTVSLTHPVVFTPKRTLEKAGILTNLTLNQEGLRFQGIIEAGSYIKNKKVKNSAKKLPKLLPQNTVLLISGGNLEQFWEKWLKENQSSGVLPISTETFLTTFKSLTDLDWKKDFLPAMGEEFSLALIPAWEEGETAKGESSWLLTIKTNKRSDSERVLQQLDRLIESRYSFKVEQSEEFGKPVTQWTSPLGGIELTHGWLEKDVCFLKLGTSSRETALAWTEENLLSNPLYQSAIAPSSTPNIGSVFVNLEGVREIAKDMIQLPPQQKSVLDALNTVGLTMIQERSQTRFESRVQLKPAASVPEE